MSSTSKPELRALIDSINHMGWKQNENGSMQSTAALNRDKMDHLTEQAALAGIQQTSEVSSNGGYQLIFSAQDVNTLRRDGATFPDQAPAVPVEEGSHLSRLRSKSKSSKFDGKFMGA